MKATKLFFILLCLAALAAPAAAAGGAGTAANPYVIQTPAELQSIANNLAAYYVLGNDIDLSGVTWTPIGSTSAPFSGQLDGNGHTISNLDISSSEFYAGFFSVLTSGATIKDLKLIDCNVESTTSACGCLIGQITMSSNVHETVYLNNIDMINCRVNSKGTSVGALCGLCINYAVVEITDCTFINCVITSTYNAVACISGDIRSYCNIVMSNCIIKNSITESIFNPMVGILTGRIGPNNSVILTSCTVENSIAKGSKYIGGISGFVDGPNPSIGVTGCTVKDCTVVATENYAGGISGFVDGPNIGVFNSNTITGCTILATSYAATICPVLG